MLCHDRPVSPTVAHRQPKVRLDELLVERGLAETRAKAQALVLAGKVRVGDGDAARRDRKPGDRVGTDEPIALDAPEPYVGRGGYKLAAALDAFGIDPTGMNALDVGASTGGFTDVLLQRGAGHVYALDVGRGQLAESLRRDPRVTSMERTNARTLTAATFPGPIDLAVIDVSFISLDKVLGPTISTLTPAADIVALVKPQFEAGKGRTDHGVVRDPAIHREVLESVTGHARSLGLGTRDVIASPLTGHDGNREFLVHLAQGPGCADLGRAHRRGHRRVTVKRIGFAYNPTIEATVELAARASGWCHQHSIDEWRAQSGDLETLRRELPTTDALVVLGGDGTFLRAARAVAEIDVPLLGINLGKIGFLSKAEAGDLESVLEHIVAGEYRLDERMAIEGRIMRGGGLGDGDRHIALNDIVVARGSLARVCRLDVSIDDSHLATFIADGLVVASPTGSTGYSFSAGGPILDPASRNLVVTPIAAYLSAIRSVVVSPEQVVRCRVVDAHEALVSVDGREDLPIAVGDTVEVRALDHPIRLIEPKGAQPFWDLLRHKVELLPS